MCRHGPVIAHCTDSEDFPNCAEFLQLHIRLVDLIKPAITVHNLCDQHVTFQAFNAVANLHMSIQNVLSVVAQTHLLTFLIHQYINIKHLCRFSIHICLL